MQFTRAEETFSKIEKEYPSQISVDLMPLTDSIQAFVLLRVVVIGRIEEESNKQEKYASSEGGFKYKADNKTQEDKIGEDMPDTENKTNTDKIEHKIQDNSDDMNHIIKNETVNRSVVSDKGVITVENITEQVYGNLIDNTETKWVYSNEPIWMKVMRWLNLI